MDGLRSPRSAQTRCPVVEVVAAGDTWNLSFYWAKNSRVFSSFPSEGSQDLAIHFSIFLFETCLAYTHLALQSQPALYMRLMVSSPGVGNNAEGWVPMALWRSQQCEAKEVPSQVSETSPLSMADVNRVGS